MYMKKADKIPTEIRQTILETETKDDVIDITLAITIIIIALFMLMSRFS